MTEIDDKIYAINSQIIALQAEQIKDLTAMYTALLAQYTKLHCVVFSEELK